MENLITYVVGLPDELKIAIAVGVLFVLRLLLAGRVPEEWLTEIAGAITTALVTIIELALGLIPPQFDAIVTLVLQLIALLLGSILVARAYLLVRAHAQVQGVRF